MPSEEMITSALSNWPNGLRSGATISIPLALASMRARSWMVTISWSRSPADSSRSQMPAITKTANPTVPAILYSCTQKAGSGLAAHGMAGHDKYDQASDHWTAGPKAHGCGSSHLR